MRKEYLDIIYDLRGRVIADVERLKELSEQPKPSGLTQDENMSELRTRRSQLSSIEDLIESYIRVHS